MPEFILASGSPRRRDLLLAAGFRFQVIPSPAEEIHDAAMDPGELCRVNARAKAEAVAVEHRPAVVLGADTLVFLEGEPLGKPRSLDEARHMLRRLSGKTHEVRTGVALCHADRSEDFVVTTRVRFQPLDEQRIDRYFEQVNPLDKAGGYAVQEAGNLVVAEVCGSFDNVVGLPVAEVVEALGRFGVKSGN